MTPPYRPLVGQDGPGKEKRVLKKSRMCKECGRRVLGGCLKKHKEVHHKPLVTKSVAEVVPSFISEENSQHESDCTNQEDEAPPGLEGSSVPALKDNDKISPSKVNNRLQSDDISLKLPKQLDKMQFTEISAPKRRRGRPKKIPTSQAHASPFLHLFLKQGSRKIFRKPMEAFTGGNNLEEKRKAVVEKSDYEKIREKNIADREAAFNASGLREVLEDMKLNKDEQVTKRQGKKSAPRPLLPVKADPKVREPVEPRVQRPRRCRAVSTPLPRWVKGPPQQESRVLHCPECGVGVGDLALLSIHLHYHHPGVDGGRIEGCPHCKAEEGEQGVTGDFTGLVRMVMASRVRKEMEERRTQERERIRREEEEQIELFNILRNEAVRELEMKEGMDQAGSVEGYGVSGGRSQGEERTGEGRLTIQDVIKALLL